MWLNFWMQLVNVVEWWLCLLFVGVQFVVEWVIYEYLDGLVQFGYVVYWFMEWQLDVVVFVVSFNVKLDVVLIEIEGVDLFVLQWCWQFGYQLCDYIVMGGGQVLE